MVLLVRLIHRDPLVQSPQWVRLGRVGLRVLYCHPDQLLLLVQSNHPGLQGQLVLLVLWVQWVQCCHPDQLVPFLHLDPLGQ